MSTYRIEWHDADKPILKAAHEVAGGSPSWLLPPEDPADAFPLNILPGGEPQPERGTAGPSAERGARLLLLATDLSCSVVLELRTPYPTRSPAAGLALPAGTFKTRDEHTAVHWPAPPQDLLDVFVPAETDTIEISGTDIGDASDALSHAHLGDGRRALAGVQLAPGVGAWASDGHKMTLPTSVARSDENMPPTVFLPASLITVLHAFGARDARIERWQNADGTWMCVAHGLRWSATWALPSGACPERNHARMVRQLLDVETWATSQIVVDAPLERTQRAECRKAVAALAGELRAAATAATKIEKTKVAPAEPTVIAVSARLRLGSHRIEIWATRISALPSEERGAKIRTRQEDEFLAAIGHPDALPVESTPWVCVYPPYLLDALETASPLREVRMTGKTAFDSALSPVLFYGERQTSMLMPIRPSDEDTAALKAQDAARAAEQAA